MDQVLDFRVPFGSFLPCSAGGRNWTACSQVQSYQGLRCEGQLMFKHPNPQPSFFPNFNAFAAVATSPRQQPPVSCFAHKPGKGKSRSLDLQRGGASRSSLDDKTSALASRFEGCDNGAEQGARAHVRAQGRKKVEERERKNNTLWQVALNINTCKGGSTGKTDGPYEHSPFFSRSVWEGKGRFPSLSARLSLLTFLNKWKIR